MIYLSIIALKIELVHTRNITIGTKSLKLTLQLITPWSFLATRTLTTDFFSYIKAIIEIKKTDYDTRKAST